MTDTGLTQEGLDWSRPDNVQQNHPSKHFNASSGDALPTFHRMLPKKQSKRMQIKTITVHNDFNALTLALFPTRRTLHPMICICTVSLQSLMPAFVAPPFRLGGAGGGAGMAELTLC